MRPTNAQIVMGLGAIVIAVAGFVAGRSVRADPSPGFAFDLSSQAYEVTAPEPGLTRGGFSGFGETAGLPGQTLLSGKVTSVSPQEVVIEAADGTRSTVRLANPGAVSRIEAATRGSLVDGVTVVLRQAEDSNAIEAVLIVATP